MNQSKSGQEVAKKSPARKATFTKNDLRFWEGRVFLPTYKSKGETCTSSAYAVRIQAHGERRNVTLDQTAKREAAKAALRLYRLVQAHGWDEGLGEFRGERPEAKSSLTLGDYLEEVAATGKISPRTFRIYARKIRRIGSDIARVKLPAGLSKNDYVNGGADEWRRRVDRTTLARFTNTRIAAWRKDLLAPVQSNPAKHHSAVRTANSCIRSAKALFAPRILKSLPHVEIPDPIPFREIELQSEQPTPYRSEIGNPITLLVAAARELAGATPDKEWRAVWKASGQKGKVPRPDLLQEELCERRAWRKHQAFKVLVLGLSAGLRRGEIDRLQWSQIDLQKQRPVISIIPTDCFEPKAKSSGDIPIDGEMAELLRQWKAESTDRFVVGGVEPIVNTDRLHYRADRAHKEAITWLRSKGITAGKAIHALRKEYGSLVCAKAGIHVASTLLRHSDISLTSAVYADGRGAVTSGLGSALKGVVKDGKRKAR